MPGRHGATTHPQLLLERRRLFGEAAFRHDSDAIITWAVRHIAGWHASSPFSVLLPPSPTLPTLLM